MAVELHDRHVQITLHKELPVVGEVGATACIVAALPSDGNHQREEAGEGGVLAATVTVLGGDEVEVEEVHFQ